jgi:hypothetical protein
MVSRLNTLSDSTNFQNALMVKRLILTVRTKRTMRIHTGVAGPFIFAEQLCGLENMRLFSDDRTGKVFAMIHFTPSFADGYMTFCVNSTQDPIRVREEDERTIRIKGFKVTVEMNSGRRSSLTDQPPKKKQVVLTGARVEFSTPEDKTHFTKMITEVQQHMV